VVLVTPPASKVEKNGSSLPTRLRNRTAAAGRFLEVGLKEGNSPEFEGIPLEDRRKLFARKSHGGSCRAKGGQKEQSIGLKKTMGGSLVRGKVALRQAAQIKRLRTTGVFSKGKKKKKKGQRPRPGEEKIVSWVATREKRTL